MIINEIKIKKIILKKLNVKGSYTITKKKISENAITS